MSGAIAIVGVGNVGAALAETFTRAGIDVLLGARPDKDLGDLLARCGGRAERVDPATAVRRAGLVVLAVPADAAVAALAGAAPLDGKIVVDATNPVRWQDGPVWAPPAEGSVAAELARAYPAARLVKGWNGFGAEIHAEPRLGGRPADLFLAGDDAGALAEVAALAERTGFRPIPAGPLRNAALLENLAVLWIHLAVREGRGRRIGFALVEPS
jgi:hypothetical protein